MTVFLLLAIAGMVFGANKFTEWDDTSKSRMSLAAKEALLDAENEKLDRLLAADLNELRRLH